MSELLIFNELYSSGDWHTKSEHVIHANKSWYGAKKLLDVILYLQRRSCRSISPNNLAIFIDKKFGEVPFNSISKEASFLWFQILEQWRGILTIHINLIKNRKLCFEPSTNCLLNIFITARLLTSKLVAWKCKYLKAFCSVLVIQDIQLFVIWISQSTAKIESNQWNSSLYILQPCNKIRTQLYGIYLSWDIETSYPVLQLLPQQEKNTYNHKIATLEWFVWNMIGL